MRIKRNFFLKVRKNNIKIAAIAILPIFAIGLAIYGLKTYADSTVGNFANNIRTELAIMDKVGDAEKVDYLSGETINMSVRVEVNTDGSTQNYDNAYLLIKIPKQYLDGTPRVAKTSVVDSNTVVADNDYYIYRANYNVLRAGTINSLFFNFKMKNQQTPAGYMPEVVTELMDSAGNALSRQKKSVNTTKSSVELIGVSKYTDNAFPYLAKYTDKTNTVIDRNSISTMGGVTYSISGSVRPVNSSEFGREAVRRITLTDTLPEHTTLSEKSKAEGWVYDENTRVATFIQDVDANLTRTAINKAITIQLKDTFPDSGFGRPLVNNANVKFELQSTTLTSDVSRTITPRVLPISDGDAISISKYAGHINNAVSKFINNKRSYLADGLINIDGSSGIFYLISLSVKNKGDNIDVPIYYVQDNLKDSNFEISSVQAYNVFKYVDKVEVYGVNGVDEIKIGELTGGRSNIPVSPGVSSVKFKFPDGVKFPAYINNTSSYSPASFRVELRAKNRRALLDNIPLDGNTTYAINNEAILSTPSGEATSPATFSLYREGVLVKNRLGISSVPIQTSEDISMSSSAVMVGEQIVGKDLVANPKVIYLAPKEIELGQTAKDCLVNGTCRYVENYKNTGKKAIIIDDLNKRTVTSNPPQNFFRVEETTPNGSYNIEMITIWDQNDHNYGNASDDLDFHDDGNTTSRNIARSTATITVAKPEQVAIRKFVNNPIITSGYSAANSDFRPGDLIDWRISVINIADRPLNGSRILEVLPYESDKRIVIGNNGVIKNRGTTARSVLVGPIAEREGFTILYSTDAPGANETESWNKNFVPAAQITDWSAVRMIRITQNDGYVVTPQTVVNFDLKSRIDSNAPDNSLVRNSAAVAISNTGNLVESDIVEAKIQHDAIVRGVAFEDINGNNVYDAGVDATLANRKMYLTDSSRTVLQEVETGQNGEYTFTTRKFNSTLYVQTDAVEAGKKLVTASNNTSLTNNNTSNFPTTKDDGKVESYSLSFNTNVKLAIRNFGVKSPRTTLKVRYQLANGTDLKPEVVVKNNEVFNAANPENYDTRNLRIADITKDNLVYAFSALKQGSDQETGTLKEGETVVTYIYAPKPGSSVSAQYLIAGTQTELLPTRTISPAGTQVGTPYSASKDQELTDQNGLVYVFSTLRTGSAQETGRVTETAQTVTFDYAPKPGGSVVAKFLLEDGTEISAQETIKAAGTQVGTQYSATPKNEITFRGIKYVYSKVATDSAPQTGRVDASNKVIKYVYVPKRGGQVVANFVDEQGNSIAQTKIVAQNGTPVGTNYADQTPLNEITNGAGLKFTFKEWRNTSAPKSGTVKEQTQEIVYVYSKKAGEGVASKFVNENGDEIANSEVVIATGAQVGTPYNASNPNEITDKDGLVYTFEKLTDNSAKETGKSSETAQTVIFQYKKKEGGEVVAKFLDQDGNELKNEEEVLPAGTQVGTKYESKNDNEIEKDGLVYIFEKLDDTSAPKSGRVTVDKQTVVYLYAPKKGGAVTAKFVDENGSEIQSSQIVSKAGTQVGTPYESTTVKKISINDKNYILRKINGQEKGKVVEGEIVVEYIFELEKSNILSPNTGFQKAISIILPSLAIFGTLAYIFAKKRNII